MAEFVKLCSLAEIPEPGTAREVAAGGRAICLANVNGELAALDNVCPHRQGPLGEGTVEGDSVVCPWHSWAFNTKTGETEDDPQAKVEVFPLKIDGDDVLISL